MTGIEPLGLSLTLNLASRLKFGVAVQYQEKRPTRFSSFVLSAVEAASNAPMFALLWLMLRYRNDASKSMFCAGVADSLKKYSLMSRSEFGMGPRSLTRSLCVRR